MRSSSGAVKLEFAAGVVLAAVATLMFATYFALPADDAYIVARYVHQLYDGKGLVFNPGERINAITSPLLTLVLVALHPLSHEPVDVYRGLAILLVVWTLLAIAGRAFSTTVDRLLFLALTLASPFVCFWTIGGLETPLLLSACSWLTWFALSTNNRNEITRGVQIILLAAVAFLIRYDSVLYVAPVALFVLSRHRRDAPVLVAAGSCAVVVAFWFAFAYEYYGDILPTSFYVKFSGNEGIAETLRGLGYALSFGVLALLIPAALFGFRPRTKSEEDRSGMATMLVFGAAAEVAYGVVAGDKHMLYAYRLFVPYLPSFFMLLARSSRESPAGPTGMRATTGWVLLCLGYQTSMGLVLYYLSENPNLSLAFRRQDVTNQVYEFSTIGAKYTKPFLAAVRASAREIEGHWQTVSAGKSRPMRIAVLTGGTLPYRLPEAYTLESLVSYRHRCSANLSSSADYVQVVQNADAPSSATALFGSDEKRWQLISKHEMTVDGIQNKPYRLRVDVWYQGEPAPVSLPPTIGQPCQT